MYCLDLTLMLKDIIKVFASHEKLFNIVPDIFERKESFRILFNTCHLIFSTLGRARFLTDAEIQNLEINIVNLSTLINLKFSKRNITLKMHDLLGNYVSLLISK